jgi:hypothetical protein
VAPFSPPLNVKGSEPRRHEERGGVFLWYSATGIMIFSTVFGNITIQSDHTINNVTTGLEARMGTHCKVEANTKLRDLFFRKEK